MWHYSGLITKKTSYDFLQDYLKSILVLHLQVPYHTLRHVNRNSFIIIIIIISYDLSYDYLKLITKSNLRTS